MVTRVPVDLTDDQVVELVQLRAEARATGVWELFVEAVIARRAAGVTVARIAAAAGIGDDRIRQVCRTRGYQSPAVRVPGWVPGKEAAEALGVSAQRLAAAWRAGEVAGVTRAVGWHRLWHLEPLPDWWATELVAQFDAAAARRAERDNQIQELVAGGAALADIAREVGLSAATVRRVAASR